MVSQSHNNPLVSVVLPVYNGEKYICQAIRSVLSQEYNPLEIIIVNDGSTDQTEKCLKDFDGLITVINQANCGPSLARNRGIEAANGAYITFMDADDIWAPGHIFFHLGQFRKYCNLEISVGLTAELDFDFPEDIDIKKAKERIFLHLVMGATMIKKTVFKKVGLFDEELFLRQDTDWFLRERELGLKMGIGRELVLFYRKHPYNRTNNKAKSNYYLFKILKKAKDRKSKNHLLSQQEIPKSENLDDLIDVWDNISTEVVN